MQITLSNTNQIFDVETSVAGSINYSCTYTDITTTTVGNPVDTQGTITTATTTNIVAAPAASTTRKIQQLIIFNNGATNVIKLVKDIAGTNYILYQCVLQNGETLRIVNDSLLVLNAGGIEKKPDAGVLIASESETLFKVGTAIEAAGVFYCHSKDTGFPGAWAVGTPGLDGRNTDGTLAADAGCINKGNPASGQWYLRDFDIGATVAGQMFIFDVLWVNSGLVVTTTTAQAITQAALPARDNDGTTNGNGIRVGILVTTTTTNVAAITNITLSYTNSAGVAGRTATISSFPATAVIGTFVQFQLAAGDRGVRSIQSVTFGTSLGGGAVSLICFESLISKSVILANTGSANAARNYDIPLYNGHCLLPFWMPTAATATTINGNIYFVNK